MGALTVFMAIGVPALVTRGADHREAPFVQTDGRLDINDVYAFTNGDNTVLAMTVNPGAAVLPNSPITFSTDATYQIKIDNDGDAKADIAYRFRFSTPDSNGQQDLTLWHVTGPDAEYDTGTGVQIAEGVTSTDDEEEIDVDGGGSLFAGLRDDPFFFDLVGFQNSLTFCTTDPASDFFAGLNVSAIVLEVPTTSLLGPSAPLIFPWASVNVGGLQVERMGKPVLNTVFIPSVKKDAYNAGRPINDVADFGTYFFPTATIPLLGITVQDLLLPDTLILNTAGALVIGPISFDGYPNGRALADDVIDTSFLVLENAGVLPTDLVSDCVDADDVDFDDDFPYLAEPHELDDDDDDDDDD